jgi:hypothetical protein
MRTRRIKIQRCDFFRVRVRLRSISPGGSLSARLLYSSLALLIHGEGRVDLAGGGFLRMLERTRQENTRRFLHLRALPDWNELEKMKVEALR